MLKAGARNRPGEAAQPQVPEDVRARTYVADILRRKLEEETGLDLADAGESELLDSLVYNVFPNFSVWGGFSPNIVYRWLPDGKRHDSAWMEIRILKMAPKGQPKPPPAKRPVLSDDEDWASAPELGGLGGVADQDWSNLPYVQEGLESGAIKSVHLGQYSEMRIRQMHLTLEQYMAR